MKFLCKVEDIYPSKKLTDIIDIGKYKGQTIKDAYTGKKINKSHSKKILMEDVFEENKIHTYFNGKQLKFKDPIEIAMIHSAVGIHNMSEAHKILFNCQGAPSYIEWLILKTGFNISKANLKYLESMDVLIADHILLYNTSSKNQEFRFEYDIIYTKTKHRFSSQVYKRIEKMPR